MKIVITGGAGFLGSHLCEQLLKEGNEVVCIDNLVTGNKENIAHLLENPKFSFREHDVIQGLPEDLVVDQIYHLASPASPNIHSPKSYHALAFETMQVNTVGTWKIAEYCIQNNAKLLFASTSEVYGDPLEHPQTESYRGNVSTTGPRSVYDEAKRFGETIISAFIRSKKLDARIIRIFNTYGPRMAPNDGRVVIEFMQAALLGKPFPVFGDGKQTRSFCYVSDLIDGIIKAMNTEGTVGNVYNLGNPTEFTILELAQKVNEVANTASQVALQEPLPTDDPMQRCPDITKAKQELSWEPKVQLEAGLHNLLDYLKSGTSAV